MSLIPSESLNFPDSFRANVGWHLGNPADKPKPPARPEATAATAVQSPPQTKRPAEKPKAKPIPPAPPAATTATPPESPAAKPEVVKQKSPPAPKLKAPPSPEKPALATEAEAEQTTENASDNNPPPSNLPVGGTTLTGNDAAAFLSKLFFSAVPGVSAEVPNGQTPAESAGSPPLAASSDLECASPLHALAARASAAQPQSSAPPARVSEPEVTQEQAPMIPNSAQPRASSSETIEPDKSAELDQSQPASMVIENPGQTQQLFELLAAAVQRGSLVGSTAVPETTELPLATSESAAGTEGTVSEPVAASSAPNAEATVSPIESLSSDSVNQPAAPVAPRTPAKIRIQPRRIRPRPIVPESPQPEPDESMPLPAEAEAVDEPMTPRSIEKVPKPAPVRTPVAVVPPKTDSPRVMFEEPMRQLTSRDLAEAARSIPGSGVELTYSEKRNRWIGFALSELAALTSLVLLGGYGFTHKFPDPTLKILIFILMFAAAAVAFALPIAFIRNDPGRWQKRALNYRRDAPGGLPPPY